MLISRETCWNITPSHLHTLTFPEQISVPSVVTERSPRLQLVPASHTHTPLQSRLMHNHCPCPRQKLKLNIPPSRPRGTVHYLRHIELPDKTNFYIVRTCERRRDRVTRDRDVRAITRRVMDITSKSYRTGLPGVRHSLWRSATIGG